VTSHPPSAWWRCAECTVRPVCRGAQAGGEARRRESSPEHRSRTRRRTRSSATRRKQGKVGPTWTNELFSAIVTFSSRTRGAVGRHHRAEHGPITAGSAASVTPRTTRSVIAVTRPRLDAWLCMAASRRLSRSAHPDCREICYLPMFSISHPEEPYDMGFIDKMRNKFKMGKAGPRKDWPGHRRSLPGDQGKGTACERRHPSGH
jgi:hypothetical protein